MCGVPLVIWGELLNHVIAILLVSRKKPFLVPLSLLSFLFTPFVFLSRYLLGSHRGSQDTVSSLIGRKKTASFLKNEVGSLVNVEHPVSGGRHELWILEHLVRPF